MSKKPVKKPVISTSHFRNSSVSALKMPEQQLGNSMNNMPWWVFPLAIAVLTFIAYIPSLGNSFVWDDKMYIIENPLISPLDALHFKKIWTEFLGANYHPLTMLSIAIEKIFAGNNLFLYHLDNVLIHIANSLMVYRLVQRLQGQVLVAFATGLLFGLHPMHVESVAWATERKDVLYCLFLLWSWLYYLDFSENTNNRKAYILAVVMFVLSCLSKGMAVVLPVLLVFTDYFFPVRKFSWKIVLEKAPFFAIALGTGILAIVAQRDTGTIASGLKDYFSAGERVLFVCYGISFYWAKMLFPTSLSLLYPYPNPYQGLPMLFKLAPLGLLVLVIFLAWYGRQNKIFWWAGLCFLMSILPVLQLLPVGGTIVSERYFYVASIGPLVLVAWLWHKAYVAGGGLQKIIQGLGVVATLFLGYQTFNYSKKWKDNFTVFSHVLNNHPESVVGHYNIANVYYEQKDYTKALQSYLESRKNSAIKDDLPREIGMTYYYLNDFSKAIIELESAYKQKKMEDIDIWLLGQSYHNMKQYDKAIFYFDKAIAARPQEAQLYSFQGLNFIQIPDYVKAKQYLNKAIAIDPNFLQSYMNLSFIAIKQAKYQEAIILLENAMKRGALPGFFINLGVSYVNVGNWQKGIEIWKKGVELYPQDGSMDNNIASQYQQHANQTEAIRWFKSSAQKGYEPSVQWLQQHNIPR